MGRLLTPFSFGPITARNRVVMPAMHLGLDHATHRRFYGRRARAGVGTVILGLVDTLGDPSAALGNVLRLATDDDVAPLAGIIDEIKHAGALCGVQLCPVQGYNNPALRLVPEDVPRLIASFAAAGRRARRAGADFVELLLSGGSVLSHFLSAAHNPRSIPGTFESEEARFRLVEEALAALTAELGRGFPISARIHGHEFLEGGGGSAEAARLAARLVARGVCLINVTVGGHRARLPQIALLVPPAGLVHLARPIRDAISAPVIAGGRVRLPHEAEALLASGLCDAVTLGRALIADPDWVRKAADGTDDLVPCLSCGVCLDEVMSAKRIRCAADPTLGLAHPPADGRGGPAVVVGGGPAGLEAAYRLAATGRPVTLFEREERLGGAWNQAATAHGREELAATRRAFVRRLAPLPVALRLGETATPDAVRSLSPELVVLAAGGRPRRPELPGLDRHRCVLDATTALRDPERVGRDVVIIGAGGVGVELAIHLAGQGEPSLATLGYLARHGTPAWLAEALTVRPDRRVTLLRRRGAIGLGLGRSTRWTLLLELARLGVRTIDRCVYEELTADALIITERRAGQRMAIPADTVVLCCGREPDPELVARCAGTAPHVVAIGDTARPGMIADAVGAVHTALAPWLYA